MEMKSEVSSAIEELSLMVKIRHSEGKVKAGEDHEEEEEEEATRTPVQQEDPSTPTVPFLSLCASIIRILDKIGPTMAVMRQDLHQNIKRLEMLYETDPLQYSHLEQMLKKETKEGTAKKSTSCSKAILWLTRSLDFTVALLQRFAKDEEKDMEKAVEESYNVTLKPFHGWISSAAFKVALKLVPDYQTFINILKGKHEDNCETLKEDIKMLISLLQPFLDEVHCTLKMYKLDELKAT